MKDGWYSPTAARIYGTSWYETADGKEVEVTALCDGADYKYPDRKYVGKVVKYLRKGQPSTKAGF